MNNDVNQFFSTITGRILLVLVLLIIGFFGGMQYKSYQIKKIVTDTADSIQQTLNAQTSQANSTAIKENLDGARAQAELYYDSNASLSYKGVCSDPVNGIPTSITSEVNNSATCNDSATAYALEAPLPDNNNYCVDSTGKSKVEANELGSATVCS